MPTDFLLRPATRQDSQEIRSLLKRSSLPTLDLDRSRPDLIVACEAQSIIGVGGMERYGATGLLRSLAVSSHHRGLGIGHAIVEELERHARSLGITEMVLLTETARPFFELRGYQITDRAGVPAAVQQSEEFRSICPQSAACMTKKL